MPEFSHIRSFPFLFLSHAGTHLVGVSSSLPDISSARPVWSYKSETQCIEPRGFYRWFHFYSVQGFCSDR